MYQRLWAGFTLRGPLSPPAGSQGQACPCSRLPPLPPPPSVWKQKWKEWYLPELSLMPLNITEVSELHKGSVWTLQTKVIPTASVLSSPVTLVRFPLHSHKPRALRLVFQHPAVLQS